MPRFAICVSSSAAFAATDSNPAIEAAAEPAGTLEIVSFRGCVVSTTDTAYQEEHCWREGLQVAVDLGVVVIAEGAMALAISSGIVPAIIAAGVVFLDASFDLADSQDVLAACLTAN